MQDTIDKQLREVDNRKLIEGRKVEMEQDLIVKSSHAESKQDTQVQ